MQEKNEMKILNFGGVDCYEKDGTAYLKLETVARGLGFTQIAKSGNEVVRWERVRKYLEEFGVPTCGDDGFITENIFYRLAMKAKNETAERFQAKVADEIIPSIRRHGAYMTENTLQKALTNPDFLIQLAAELKNEQEKRRELEEQTERDKPKVLFADAVSTSNSEILIGDLAKIIKQNGVDIGQNRLFDWMRRNGYLIRQQGTSYNMPTQRSMDMGLFRIKETAVTHSDGHVSVSKTVKVLPKGQIYFVNKFLDGKNGSCGNVCG